MGAALHENAVGTDWSNVSGGSGNEFTANNMKWYQFVIYVQLFLTAIFKGFEGIRTMTGNSMEMIKIWFTCFMEVD